MRHGSRRLSAGRGPKRGKAEVGQVPVGRLGLVNATDLDGGFVAWTAAGLPRR